MRTLGRMRGLPLKAFPLGGRWHGEAVTDEGAMIERFFVGPDALIGPLDGSFRRGISPPAGGELLCPWRQSNQNATGGRLRMDTPCPYSPYPRTPITRVIPWGWQNPSGAQNLSGCLTSRRATGPWVCKICSWRGSRSAPEFAEPTLLVRFRRRGDPCGRPKAFPLQGGRCPRRGRMRVFS